MNRRKFLKRAAVVSFAGTAAAFGYSRMLERHWLEVTTVSMDIGLGDAMTVAVLGDLHFDPLYETDYLARVVDVSNAISPDVIVLTGDYFSKSADRLEELAGLLGSLSSRLGVFAVLGNHDQRIAADGITARLASAGVVVLRNRSVPLPTRPGWYVTGLESYWTGSPDPTVLAATPAGSRHLLLVHEPDSFDTLTDDRIALQVSGHTHGGQIRLPLMGALALPSWGKKYSAGYYERGRRRLYVNRGIGTVDEHHRLNCRPEITKLALS